jgi:hypothetical protein
VQINLIKLNEIAKDVINEIPGRGGNFNIPTFAMERTPTPEMIARQDWLR